MKINHSKKLQNTSSLYMEQKLLELKVLRKSIEKENDYDNYVKRLNLFDNKTGEFTTLSNFTNFKNCQIQTQKNKASALIKQSVDNGLVGIFLTLTTPIHPYHSRKYKDRRIYYKENEDYLDSFGTLECGISNSLALLKEIDHKIYKALKAKTKKSLVHFIKAYEIHSSMMPHLHCLIFLEEKYVKTFKQIVQKHVAKYALNPVGTDFQRIKTKTKKDSDTKFLNIEDQTKIAGYYIQKYLFKSFDNKDQETSPSQKDFNMRLYHGYMRYFNVRQLRMSNLTLTITDYKKIYHSLPRTYIKELIPKLNRDGIGLFYFVMNNYKKIDLFIDDNEQLYEYECKPKLKEDLETIFLIHKIYKCNKLESTKVFLVGEKTYDSTNKVLHIKI